MGRNTASALTLADLAARADGLEPVLVVTPVDQTVANCAAFTQAMQRAIREGDLSNLVIHGFMPDFPETGNGYMLVQAIHSGTASHYYRHALCGETRRRLSPVVPERRRQFLERGHVCVEGLSMAQGLRVY